MRLGTVKLTNFRQHADTAIEFGTGITGVIGPNGSGKTTILEAIAWALYGNEAARGRRDSLRFARAEPKATVRVELEFELAGHRYRIVRGISSAELYLDGGEQPIANSITAVGEIVQRRLGMSRTEFFNTYFTGQKELSVMAAVGPTERAQFLSRVLGYERLRAAQDAVRDRRRDLTGELTGLRQAMPNADAVARAVADAETRLTDATRRSTTARAARDAAQAALAEITPRWESAQRERSERQTAIGELRVAELEHTARARDAARAASAVADAERAVAELNDLSSLLAPVAALTTEREALDVLARHEGRRATLVEAIRSGEDELARLMERLSILEDAPRIEEEATVALEGKRADLRAAEDALAAARTQWARDRQEAETRRDALRSQYADVKEQRDRIVAAGEDGTCPTCQRPLGTHFRAVLDMLDAQLDAVRVDGNYFKSRVEQLEKQPANIAELDTRRRAVSGEVATLERRVATAQAGAAELADVMQSIARQEQRLSGHRADVATLPAGYDAARHDAVRRELERLAPLEQRAARLAVTTDRIEALRADRVAADAAASATAARVESLRAALGHAQTDADYDRLRAAFDASSAALRDASVALATADGESAAAKEQLARARDAREELARSEARLRELTTERRMHDELDQAFTDLRTELNFALRPELSKLASDFLTDLTDGRYAELDLDDQYDLVLVEDGTPKPVISGGEEDLANLALRLAISQMIAARAGQQFSLLILDEVFGSLDEVRRQNVVALLRRLRDRFEQVVLITHIEAVRDGCDQVLSVRYDPASGAAVVEPSDPAFDAQAVLATVAE